MKGLVRVSFPEPIVKERPVFHHADVRYVHHEHGRSTKGSQSQGKEDVPHGHIIRHYREDMMGAGAPQEMTPDELELLSGLDPNGDDCPMNMLDCNVFRGVCYFFHLEWCVRELRGMEQSLDWHQRRIDPDGNLIKEDA